MCSPTHYSYWYKTRYLWCILTEYQKYHVITNILPFISLMWLHGHWKLLKICIVNLLNWCISVFRLFVLSRRTLFPIWTTLSNRLGKVYTQNYCSLFVMQSLSDSSAVALKCHFQPNPTAMAHYDKFTLLLYQ